MNITKFAIENKTLTYFTVFLFLVLGTASFFKLGQLEDPDFAVKMAVITCNYPGATPAEVEQEVTEVIEKKIQELPFIYNILSYSEAGTCKIKIEIKPTVASSELPQVWDELRKKVRDIHNQLPPGCSTPKVVDDFGYVYGFLLAMSGDGYSPAEMEEYAKFLQKEFNIVQGVSRVSLWGIQPKVIYIDASQKQLAEFGISIEDISKALKTQNMVIDSGSIEIQDQRIRVVPTGTFLKPEDIGRLKIRPSSPVLSRDGLSQSDELIEINDFATVRQGYLEPAPVMGRLNGEPAIMLAMANQTGGNVVHTGRRLDKRMEELKEQLPVGIEIKKISWQSDSVSNAINSFLINLLQAVAIVLIVLTIPMGIRMGVIIGSGLILTILATFIVMSVLGIDLQRMSLGALIIALGMMVDNSIVVADGILARIQGGMDRKEAAIEAATQPSIPLLGATVIAVMAFYPIFASTEGAGEYCATLFIVVGISLMISWVISITITPVQCMDMLKAPKVSAEKKDPYESGFYKLFGKCLNLAIKMRYVTVLIVIGLLVISGLAFKNVKQLFFPDASRHQFMVDYWDPQGTRIQNVSERMKLIEEKLSEYDEISDFNTYIGAGPPRFYLPVEPEGPDQGYSHIVVNTTNLKAVSKIIDELNPWMAEQFPDANCRARKFGVGPSKTWPFELRIIGPKDADLQVLRDEAAKVLEILEKSPYAKNSRTDMRAPRKIIVPEYDQSRGRWADINRYNIAEATKRAFDGVPVGLYREKDSLYPILLRHVEEERRNLEGLISLQVQPSYKSDTVPLAQVTKEIKFTTEDPLINRMDRRRMISIQAAPNKVTFPTMKKELDAELSKIELPEGYTFFWAGEQENTERSQKSLIPGMVPAFILVVFIIVALFNAFRPALIILIVVPFAMIGVVTGLLVFDAAFGFVALLGAMSLVGMMIKNSIVLLDEVNLNLSKGLPQYQAMIRAAQSRLRPVVLAAATTVLGVVPLLQDLFWVGLAVVIMVGLTFGTILTMVLVPVLYSIFFRLKNE